MPPRIQLSSHLAVPWKCPQCTIRSISTSAQRYGVGPEHPRYIDIPEPPQQSLPDRPPVKGVLPVPRDVFSDAKTKDQSRDESIAEATQLPRKVKVTTEGSREEWKVKMSDLRRRNLREGLKSLRVRQVRESRKSHERSVIRQKEREELLHRPEREDERLTSPSHNLDLDTLSKNQSSDPTRASRLQLKEANLERAMAAKKAKRLDDLHTLYMNARDFIVTPEQLEKAIDDAFGTPEDPVLFGTSYSPYDTDNPERRSIWAEGKPERIQDMLNRANRQGGRSALDGVSGYSSINKDRVKRMAEKLTGGKMDAESRH